MGLFAKIFGTDNDRQIKKLEVIAAKVEALVDKYSGMTDKELTKCTETFKRRLANGETLDDLLPDAYACVREASTRVIGLRHFHVQILGGIALHQGRIAEMCTGEGKTLVETLPAYLNALTGKGVHIVTVNDYLAKRDAEWMGQIFRFLGLTVGVITNQQEFESKKNAYDCDITYGTNSAFGFDFLRDNQVRNSRNVVQRELNFVIIDEVDSVLIDEARTPLIISGKNMKSSKDFYSANSFAKILKAPNPDSDDETEKIGDFEINEEDKKIVLTERGTAKAESFFGVKNLGDYDNIDLYRNIRLAIRANFLMKKDRDYVVKDNQVIIVDEFTGRLQFGRRFNDGLHTAIEAKENIRIKDENQIIATITYQNLFRMYRKISGMTGTAKTEEEEFKNIYGLDIVVIPTNKPIQRIDENDVIYKTRSAKLKAIVEDIKNCYQKGQPVLVGTVSVEKSEELSNMLYRERIPHNVLNAKNHESEAEIVAQAGRKGSVTIATNMAGRGTDIKLGGNPEFMAKQYLVKCKYSDKVIAEATSMSKDSSEAVMKVREIFTEQKEKFAKQTEAEKQEVLAVGGLRIIGTERHESRRIDNQLRGRSGRQGDVGSSVFYISFEDDLVRIFAGDRLANLGATLPIADDMPISMKMVSNRIEDAQKKIEARNYSIRKNVLSYDDVMNKQREIIYSDRRKMLYDKTFYQENYEILRDSVSSCLSLIDFSQNPDKIIFERINRYIVQTLLQRDDWPDYEFTTVLSKEDFGGVDIQKFADVMTEKAVKYYKKVLNGYLDLLDKDVYRDAIEISVNLSAPIDEWDYKKLNSIVRNHLPTELNIEQVFAIDDATELKKRNALSIDEIVKVINEKISVALSSAFAKYDEQIISSYVAYTLEKGYREYGLDDDKFTTLLNENLSSDHQIVLTKQDLTADNDKVIATLENELSKTYAKRYLDASSEVLDLVLDAFLSKLSASPFEWDFKKADKDYCSALFVKKSNGESICKDIITSKMLGDAVLDHFAVLATDRIEKIYSQNHKDDADEILERLKENYNTLNEYVRSLLLSRVDVNENPTKWDYYRLSEVLGFNCLQKSDEDLTDTLISKDDLNTFGSSVLRLEIKTRTMNAYARALEQLSRNVDKRNIQRALSTISVDQPIKSFNDFLSARLLPKEIFTEDVTLIDEQSQSLDIEQKVDLIYDALNMAISRKTDSFNMRILESLLNWSSSKNNKSTDVILKISDILSLNTVTELKDINSESLRVSQTVSIVDREIKDRIQNDKAQICARAVELAEAVKNGRTVDEMDRKTYEKICLSSCIRKAINRTLGAYRSHRDEQSILNDKGLGEISNLIGVITYEALNLQGCEYYDWNVLKINFSLALALLPPSTPVELIATFFTQRDVSDVVRDSITDNVYRVIEPIYVEIIEKSKKAGYKSAHNHILKMLPEVIAEVVADNIDFANDINTWNYDKINDDLRERIVPDSFEDVELIDLDLAQSMNIDTVIDAVVDKVVEMYNEKSVSFNLDLINEYILDEVKDNVDRRQPIENYDYKLLNRRLQRLFLAPVDRDRELLSEDVLRPYLDENSMTLTHNQVTQAIRDRLLSVYLERIDAYDRFVDTFCRRRAKPSRTFGFFERIVLLSFTDKHWFDHIDNMERLRAGIGLRALGQQNPITCYQSEGFQLFDEMIGLIHEDVVIHALKDDPNEFFGKKEESVSDRYNQKKKQTVYYKKVGAQPIVKTGKKIGPNDPCPCGSGKKYKKCCMNKKSSVNSWNAIDDE